MAEGFDLEHFKSFMECSICLDRFDNPKQLRCFHHYCKQCLEDVKQFRDDGSVIINCPMRCSVQTIIAPNETINDLSASYELKGMLDILKMKSSDLAEDAQPKCVLEGCSKVASVSCCDTLHCGACYDRHKRDRMKHERTVSVQYNRRLNKLLAMCDEHLSEYTHICDMEDSWRWLCLYCLWRGEDEEAHVADLAHLMPVIRSGLQNCSRIRSEMLKFLELTKNELVCSKEDFDQLMAQRKKLCHLQYAKFLEEEEASLRKEFGAACQRHLDQYLDISPDDHSDLLAKHDFELLFRKNELLDEAIVYQNLVDKSSLHKQIFTVSQEFGFLNEKPLGRWELLQDDGISWSDMAISTIRTNFGEMLRDTPHTQGGNTEENKDENESCDVSKLSLENNETKKKKKKKKKKNKEQLDNCLVANPSPRRRKTFMDFEINSRPIGRLVLVMYEDIAPKTCRNFIDLCTPRDGYGYKQTTIHYMDEDKGYFEAGDIRREVGSLKKRDEFGEMSIHGRKFFPRENHIVKHDKPGIVTMVKQGFKDFTSSLFAITTEPIPTFDGHNVAFGKVTDETFHVVLKIMNTHFTPCEEITVVDCGTCD